MQNGAIGLGVRLNKDQVDQFERYYRGLVEWNARMNLTAITGWEDVQRRHFLDSLTLSGFLIAEQLENCRFIDIGSGAGLPGIPMKIAFPGLTGVLIDATERKIRFLRSMIDRLALPGLEARTGRAEDMGHRPEMREQFDLVLARAVAPMAILAELTLPFCRIGGHVVVHKTLGAADEIRAARYAIEALGGLTRRELLSELPDGVTQSLLLVIEKITKTPDRYPRRPGIPAKRPLSCP